MVYVSRGRVNFVTGVSRCIVVLYIYGEAVTGKLWW